MTKKFYEELGKSVAGVLLGYIIYGVAYVFVRGVMKISDECKERKSLER